jgi:hypothetical protein
MGSYLVSLTREPLSRLLVLAKATPRDDSLAMGEILRRFEPLTRSLTWNLCGTRCALRDDVANACRLGLVRAAHRELKTHSEDNSILWVSLLEGDEPADLGAAEDAQLERLEPWGDGPIARAVSTLSPDQQRLLTLRYVYDQPLHQIATASGTSVSAVSQRLATIHRQLEHAAELALAA